MWNNHLVFNDRFLIGLTNTPIAGWFFGLRLPGYDGAVYQQDDRGAKILLSSATIRMMNDEELIDALRWFAEREPEITAIHNAQEFNLNEQFCPDEDLDLIIQSDLTPSQTLEKVIAERSYRQGEPRPKREKIAKPLPQKTERIPGHVYLLLADNGLYKIGWAANVDNRILQLEPKLPYDLELIHSIKTDRPRTLERELHGKFADKRVRGEWFKLDTEDVAYIKGIEDEKTHSECNRER